MTKLDRFIAELSTHTDCCPKTCANHKEHKEVCIDIIKRQAKALEDIEYDLTFEDKAFVDDAIVSYQEAIADIEELLEKRK